MANRHLPWALAVLGALHGWFVGSYFAPRQWDPNLRLHVSAGPAPTLLALIFGSILFIGAWIHVSKPLHEHKNVWAAAGRILLTCAAFGLTPVAVMFFFNGWFDFMRGLENRLEIAVAGVGIVFAFVLPAVPPALLLIYAVTRSVNPRRGSILAGVDRAEHALAVLSAIALLPWWYSNRPSVIAWLLALMALPAIAIGLHAFALARQVKGLGVVFNTRNTHANAALGLSDPRYGAAVGWDIGLGAEERSFSVEKPHAYRNPARSVSVASVGSPAEGIRAARRIMKWSLVACVAALAHAGVMLMLDNPSFIRWISK